MKPTSKRYVLPLAAALFTLIFLACSKNNPDTPGDEGPGAMVTHWMDAQIALNNPDGKIKVERLKNNLLLEQAWAEPRNDQEQLLVVPVASAYQTHTNNGKNVRTYLMCIQPNGAAIRTACIVQFEPEAGQAINKLPVNTLQAIYNSESSATVTCNGKFSMFNLRGRFLYDISYHDGKRVGYSVMEQKNNPNGRNGTTCIDWYLVTYYENSQGEIVILHSQYITTSCNGCIPSPPNADAAACDDSNPGGGGYASSAEVLQKTVSWVVHASAVGGWHVKSYETLNGERQPAAPAVFTSITHNNSTVFNTLTPVYPTYAQSYTELSQLVYLTGLNSAAVANVRGKVTRQDQNTEEIGSVKTWLAVTEFP